MYLSLKFWSEFVSLFALGGASQVRRFIGGAKIKKNVLVSMNINTLYRKYIQTTIV